MRDSIRRLITSSIRRGKAIKCEKQRMQREYKILIIVNNVLPILSSAIITYSIFSQSDVKIYILVILSILTVVVTTYISFSNYAENLAKYEMASSTYIQIGKNLKKINLANEKSAEWISGCYDAYISMLTYFDGVNNIMENASSSMNSSNRIQTFYERAQSHCCDFELKDDALKKAYNDGLYFHVFVDNGVHYCGTHGDPYINYHFEPEFKKNILAQKEFESYIKYYDDVKNIYCISNGHIALCIIIAKDYSENDVDPADDNLEIIITRV
jgi:hypothetical protein